MADNHDPEASTTNAAKNANTTCNSGDAGVDDVGPRQVFRAYLLENSEDLRDVSALRQMGWKSEAADRHFDSQRQSSDKATRKNAKYFYKMMQGIGRDMAKSTGFLGAVSSSSDAAVLDLCMAPGGFVHVVQTRSPKARIRAFSLPVELGGHEVLAKCDDSQLQYVDLNVLAGDMGATPSEMPAAHPDAAEFDFSRRFSSDEKYDLVLCDGQVLRTHARAEWRERHEARRLMLVQLALGLEHVRVGGTMVLLLHKLERWDCARLLDTFRQFSAIKLYKHHKCHATRSSFYIVAKNIMAQSDVATAAVETWKRDWRAASFSMDDESIVTAQPTVEDVQGLIDSFGEELLAMGANIWQTQARALREAPYIN